MPAPKTLQSRLALLLLIGVAVGLPALLVYNILHPVKEERCYHDCYKTYSEMKRDAENTGKAAEALRDK
jgi:hypothetical protein